MRDSELLASHVEWLRGDHVQCNPFLADIIERQQRALRAAQYALTDLGVCSFGLSQEETRLKALDLVRGALQ